MASHLYEPGQRIEGSVYRVVRHLATGGMGSVYDVEDVSVGKRYVLKTLNPELVGREDLARRMDAEARILVTLQHPNIVEVVTAGATTDEWRLPFYVMEKLNGQNLRTIIEKKGTLGTTLACQITMDLLEALEHAHDHGVIHRDVKPENIFLHKNRNGTTITKLLDFGIMRLMDGGRRETQGRFVGTLRYAAPEQIMGSQSIGPAADLYAAGLVLYEMLGGRGPFDDLGEPTKIGHAHANKAPPPIVCFAPHLPRELQALVMSALQKHPDARPRDAFTFAAELRRFARPAEELLAEAPTAVAPLSVAPHTVGAPAADDRTEAGFEPIPGEGGTLRDAAMQDASKRSDDSIAFARTLASGEGEIAAPAPLVDRQAPTGGFAYPAPASSQGYGTERLGGPRSAGRAGTGPSSGDIVFPAPMSVASTTGSVSSEAVPRKKSGAAAFLGALAGVVLVGVGAAAAAVYLVRPTGEAHVPAHATSVDRAAAAPTAPPAGPRAGDSAGVSAAAPPTSASVAASPKTVTTRQIGVPGAPRATTPAAAPAAPGRPVSAATQPSAAAAAPPIAQPPATTPSAAPPPPSRPASPPASGGLPTHFQVD